MFNVYNYMSYLWVLCVKRKGKSSETGACVEECGCVLFVHEGLGLEWGNVALRLVYSR